MVAPKQDAGQADVVGDAALGRAPRRSRQSRDEEVDYGHGQLLGGWRLVWAVQAMPGTMHVDEAGWYIGGAQLPQQPDRVAWPDLGVVGALQDQERWGAVGVVA